MKQVFLLAIIAWLFAGCAVTKSVRNADFKAFYEEIPGWNMAEAAVTDVTIDPERTSVGQAVIINATISNLGTGTTSPVTIHFLVDGNEIDLQRVDPLGPLKQALVRTRWQANEPGRHEIEVFISFDSDAFNGSLANNSLSKIVRVEGEGRSKPEIEVDISESALLNLQFGEEESNVFVVFRNPSFAPVENFFVQFYLDGEPLGRKRQVEYLAPGSEQRIQLKLNVREPGEHRISLKMELPDNVLEYKDQQIKGWQFNIPHQANLNDVVQKHKWISIGPKQLDNGNVGRITCFTFHPLDPKIMFAGGFGNDAGIPAGTGIWKTTDGGLNWMPIGDKLPSMMIASLAIDPLEPSNIYAGTPHNGIFKSTDSGKTWYSFAEPQTVGHYVKELIVRTEPSGSSPRVVIYAASNIGVLRFKTDDPGLKTCQPADWKNIKKGIVTDLVIHPDNRSTLYASMEDQGLFRTTNAVTAKEEITVGVHDWEQLNNKPNNGLPPISGWHKLMLDIFPGNPQLIYAGVLKPKTGYTFALYRSDNGGENFTLLAEYPDGTLHGGIYNPFVRVHPTLPDMVYFGGVSLYKWSKYQAPSSGTNLTYQIPKSRADMKELKFSPVHPTDSNKSFEYFLACDQGMFIGTAAQKPINYKKGKNIAFGEAGDIIEPRNNNLRVTQIYDFDVSTILPLKVLAGTQDDGTIMYEGNDIWKEIKGGDGNYSVIAPSNSQILYAQHQFLSSTVRSDNGGKTWVEIVNNNGLPSGNNSDPYFIVDPNYPNTLLAAGVPGNAKDGQVFSTSDANMGPQCKWYPKGPEGLTVKGSVKRILIQPGTTHWFAGTTKGQIWTTSAKVSGSWSNIDSHPDEASIQSMAFSPANPNVLFVVYNGGTPYRRIQRLVFTPGGGWNGTWITDNLDLKTTGFLWVISGDKFNPELAYIGTDHGVFRWNGIKPTYDSWASYNDGFPLTTVVDLKVGPDSRLYAATKGRGAWMVITGN